ncbi:MAG: Uma2 family endonuclease [Planctomycetes bacterium]|nr:Uma2 family endonuclease [Planctomycetota bacterium]
MNAIFPIRRFTVDEVMRMVDAGLLDDGERLELIDGTLVTMSPQEPPHVFVCEGTRERLQEAYGKGRHVRMQFPLIASLNDLLEPDLVVVPGDRHTYATRHPKAEETILAVEASHTTQRRDRAKARIYANGKAPVYWMVDLERSLLVVHTEPVGDAYTNVVELGPDDHATLPQLDVVWRVGDLFP